MADAQLVSLTLEPADTDTHFNLRFNADGGSTWTFYAPSTATPTGPDDLSVSLLTSDVYLLDGVNSPTGNMAAASVAGNWYSYRLKNAAGYGNWSKPFNLSVAGVYPTSDDIRAELEAGGLTVSAALEALLSGAAAAGVQEFEAETHRSMLGSGSAETRYFDPPVTKHGRLRIDELYRLDTVVYRPLTGSAASYTLGTDFWTKPQNAAARHFPFEALEFRRRWSAPLPSPFRNSIEVTGLWGYAAVLPDLAIDAMVAAAILNILPNLTLALTGGLLSWTEADVTQSSGPAVWKGLADAWQGHFDAGVKAYRRWDI